VLAGFSNYTITQSVKIFTQLPPALAHLKPILGPTTKVKWDCDIRSINAELIELHNKVKPEPTFLNVKRREMHLGELLKKDLEHLASLIDTLHVAENLFVGELYSQDVTASSISSVSGFSAILVNTPLVYFLNSFFSKYSIISSYTVGGDCLEEHEKIMSGEEYKDPYILASLFKEAEVFFNKTFVRMPIKPRYLGTPYDLCEHVEGARRFIIFHEIGHFLAEQWQKNGDDGISIFERNLRDMRLMITEEQIKKWAVELWCDEFATRSFNQFYMHRLDDEQVQHEATNGTCGALLLFFMLHFLEKGFKTFHKMSVMYPPAKLRYTVVRETLKGLRIYQHPHLVKIAEQFIVGMRNVEHYLFAGLGFDPRTGPLALWVPTECSPFGQEMSQAFFEDVHENNYFTY
jgi:hypothetical protein